MSGDSQPASVTGRPLLHRLDEDFVAWPWLLETDCLSPGIPPRPMSPAGLRRWLLAVGLAGYGLRNYARRIHVRSSQDLPDLHADLVTGFLVRLATIDPQGRNLAGRLIDSAIGPQHAGHRDGPCIGADRGCDEDGDGGRDDDGDREGLDRVLRRAAARAAHAGTPVSARDVELIAATRLDRRPLPEVADLLGIGVEAAYKRRRRAEQRLTAILRRTS